MSAFKRRAQGLAAVMVAAFVIDGCDFPGAGPCIHVYEDPVIRMAAVTGADGGTVGSVTLSGFAVDGRSVNASMLLEAAYGVDVVEGALVCDVACGFGTEPGTYTFTIDAEGHAPEPVTVEARYAEFSGGCPSSSSGSTVVDLELGTRFQ